MKKLKVLIAGGGIGGLCAAIALMQRGFDVEVYEQAHELREIGAGLQISPNGNRALDSLGVFKALQALSSTADGKEIRLWNSGKTWKLFDLGDAAIKKYGYPYLTVFRPDLLRVLVEQADRLSPGAIHLDARCKTVTQDGEKVTLELTDGRQVQGDVIVGADGVWSNVRSALFGPDEVRFLGMIAWRALIPMDALPERMKRNVAINWVGSTGHVVHYPVQGGKKMNFVGTLEGQTWNGPPYTVEGSRDDCLRAFEGWHDDVLEMIRHAPVVTQWAMCGREFLDTWSTGRATLLGDACHVTLPFLAQGAVSSIEDGVVLARALEAHPDDVPEALRRYDEARRPHAYRMVRGSTDNRVRFHNPALAAADTAEDFISREWQSKAISDRYDWLFNYDVEGVEV